MCDEANTNQDSNWVCCQFCGEGVVRGWQWRLAYKRLALTHGAETAGGIMGTILSIQVSLNFTVGFGGVVQVECWRYDFEYRAYFQWGEQYASAGTVFVWTGRVFNGFARHACACVSLPNVSPSKRWAIAVSRIWAWQLDVFQAWQRADLRFFCMGAAGGLLELRDVLVLAEQRLVLCLRQRVCLGCGFGTVWHGYRSVHRPKTWVIPICQRHPAINGAAAYGHVQSWLRSQVSFEIVSFLWQYQQNKRSVRDSFAGYIVQRDTQNSAQAHYLKNQQLSLANNSFTIIVNKIMFIVFIYSKHIFFKGFSRFIDCFLIFIVSINQLIFGLSQYE